MKTNLMKAFAILACISMAACKSYDGPTDDRYGDISAKGTGNGKAGKLTAGEWRDLDNWDFWASLVNGQNDEFVSTPAYWGYYTNCRIATRIMDEQGNPQCGVNLILKDTTGNTLWTAVTDNRGEANLWPSLFTPTEAYDSVYTIIIGNVEGKAYPTLFGDTVVTWNEYHVTAPELSGADILFIVDATGSMSDEIRFLKEDLLDILNKAQVSDLQVGALFYRDEGDDYVTKVSNLNSDIQTTIRFISRQNADGGGDYPEAVHTALEASMQQVTWRNTSRVKLAFMLLDAPPHKLDNVISSLHNSTKLLAANGIRVIPVAASGVDKNTEFFLRFLSICTDGTYTFLTNDSGIGHEHIEPTVGTYKVEQLNEMILRLIREYTR